MPVSMKEVGGYIEKQVAYLSGEFLFNHFLTVTYLVSLKDSDCFCASQGAVGKTPALSSLSQNAQLSVTFQRKL